MGKAKSIRPPIYKNYSPLRKAENGRGDHPQQRAHQLVAQCQESALKTHTSNIIWTQIVIFKNINVYKNTYMHIVTIEKRGHEFEQEKRDVRENVDGRKGKCYY